MAEGKLVEKAVLKTLVPPNALNAENFQELAGKAFVEMIPAGKAIFKAGDHDRKTTYLLEGQVELVAEDGKQTNVAGGTDVAKHPLANLQPRKHTAKAQTACKITRVDSDLLDILLTWDQLSGIEVSEIQVEDESDDSDWMTRILQSQAFLQVPPANIQAMFMRIQEVPMNKGEVVIKQGDDGDYYYIIKTGKAKVTRSSKTGSELTLATLKDGDAFGEEALLSEAKRNATITMDSEGTLMRLSKEDFNALLKEPMLSWLDLADAQELIKGGAKWLDVRLESEHANTGLKGSVNIPLFMLRLKADSLDPNVSYIAYCDTGRRSSAAAFLLSERGFQAYCLRGGIVEQGPPDAE
ncbi:MAG: cyclic nucleotide-binding domain-containing protein [Gammaproteobacteria bacterium]|jgi:CRP-like cAMP-binding protein|nr:cyclic nucleotide-binding domain-containing protein [Gammaproteobacteria bacterium]